MRKDMTPENLMVIRGADDILDYEPLYWSNKDGWVDLTSASIYFDSEVKAGKYHLPVGGKWRGMIESMQEVIEYMKMKYA